MLPPGLIYKKWRGRGPAILPGVETILECLVVFNAPFTFVKGLFSVIITLVAYKHISPVIKGVQE